MPNPSLNIPHVLDDPPPFHKKLLECGERPYWTADSSHIAFIESNYGDVCEIEKVHPGDAATPTSAPTANGWPLW